MIFIDFRLYLTVILTPFCVSYFIQSKTIDYFYFKDF